MIETIQVNKRDAVGSWNVRKLRASGQIPANLYGHGEANLNLSVATEAVNKLLKHGSKLVSLTGDVTDTALLREVQWDSLGSYVVHLDFARVSQTELVEISLPVHLHGEAPGAVGSGQLRFVTHEVTIRCPAAALPEFLTVEIGQLQLGQSIHVNEMKLPEGASAVTPGSVVIVQVVAAAGEVDVSAAASTAEPELIRKEKPDADAKA
jgi:large subunit ribosomal protein L25